MEGRHDVKRHVVPSDVQDTIFEILFQSILHITGCTYLNLKMFYIERWIWFVSVVIFLCKLLKISSFLYLHNVFTLLRDVTDDYAWRHKPISRISLYQLVSVCISWYQLVWAWDRCDRKWLFYKFHIVFWVAEFSNVIVLVFAWWRHVTEALHENYIFQTSIPKNFFFFKSL